MAVALPCLPCTWQLTRSATPSGPPLQAPNPGLKASLAHHRTCVATLSLGVTAFAGLCRSRRQARVGHHSRLRSSVPRRSQLEESGDALIPPMPIGRLVSKGSTTGLEYDPFDAPEFIEDEHGGGIFSWMPVTAEGGLLPEGEYDEQCFEVPADRLDYLQGGGWLQAGEGQDYRAYIVGEVSEAHGRTWQRVVLKGRKESVQEGGLRLMEGVLRQRPWDQPLRELPRPDDLKDRSLKD
ncbi:unnamed protein product [Symbiodinium natans]|uniref:Uncharacterized protein n=1 Tax=Symbiodinium natans TaxID=878477 RepID=A0A812RER4_9DINO|nr:unnamed protein product [Symbiodinium natans]